MTDDKIAEIRARHQEVPNGNLSIAAISLAHADRATLLAEVDRLRAEIERLRANLRECACACSSIRECESNWAKDNYCLHLNARKALEGKP